ncbi:hypothetical protein JMA_44380 (plasmid) [Jeotgalibacillus malaysiensis]|uniref:SbsC C-terminal domain-containing protein n=1 Tax=Jeotgalibacillus malaysiensis TaxID=1508404 RepID=A0A0B5AU60_9BACL|nr:hypothetical protein [Jeotgalibacillus malaysiensis]AJD93755.1 hypothetical protein JMA_44380 [Jeotgalibacillus malaysiensis]
MKTNLKRTALTVLSAGLMVSALPIPGEAAPVTKTSTMPSKISVYEYGEHLKRALQTNDVKYYDIVVNALRAQYGKSFTPNELSMVEKIEKDYRSQTAYRQLQQHSNKIFPSKGRTSYGYVGLLSGNDVGLAKSLVSQIGKTDKYYAGTLDLSKKIEKGYAQNLAERQLEMSEVTLFTSTEERIFKLLVGNLDESTKASYMKLFAVNQDKLLEAKVMTGLGLVRQMPHKDFVLEVKRDALLLRNTTLKAQVLKDLFILEKSTKRFTAKYVEDKTFSYVKERQVREEMLTKGMQSAVGSKLLKLKMATDSRSKSDYHNVSVSYYGQRLKMKYDVLNQQQNVSLEEYQLLESEINATTKKLPFNTLSQENERLRLKVVDTMLNRHEALGEIPTQYEISLISKMTPERYKGDKMGRLYKMYDFNRFVKLNEQVRAYKQATPNTRLSGEKSYLEKEIQSLKNPNHRAELLSLLNQN